MLSSLKVNTCTPIGKEEEKKLLTILSYLQNAPEAADFQEKVNWKELELLDYPEVVKNPMSLLQVKQIIQEKSCSSVEAVLDLIQLIWDNCKLYNKQGYYFDLAQTMEKITKKMIRNYFPNLLTRTRQTQHTKNKTQLPSFTLPINPSVDASQLNSQASAVISSFSEFKVVPSESKVVSSEFKVILKQKNDSIEPYEKEHLVRRLKRLSFGQITEIVHVIQNADLECLEVKQKDHILMLNRIDRATLKVLHNKIDQFLGVKPNQDQEIEEKIHQD